MILGLGIVPGLRRELGSSLGSLAGNQAAAAKIQVQSSVGDKCFPEVCAWLDRHRVSFFYRQPGRSSRRRNIGAAHVLRV